MVLLRRWWPLVLLAAIGCGDSKAKLPTAPVAGTITYHGKKLDAGRVVFVHHSGQAAAANLAADGSFKLLAFQGKNQVGIECFGPDQPNPDPKGRPRTLPGKSLIPGRYTDFRASGLTFDVKSREDNQAQFTLKD